MGPGEAKMGDNSPPRRTQGPTRDPDEASERPSVPTRSPSVRTRLPGSFLARFGGPKREPKWSKIGHQNGSKFSTASGAILATNLMHFRVPKWSILSRARGTNKKTKKKCTCAQTLQKQIKNTCFSLWRDAQGGQKSQEMGEKQV